MPQLLIVAATKGEILPLLQQYHAENKVTDGSFFLDKEKKIELLITGVGMVNTAWALGHYLRTNYDLVVNVGICGAFSKQLSIGEVVRISKDVVSEMGAEDDEAFINYEQLGLGGTNQYSDNFKNDLRALKKLKQTSGITVNKVHGNSKSIAMTQSLFEPEVESMEGAAFLMACAMTKTPCVQVRAVSNYVERRDRSKWNIPLAIQNLNQIVNEIISEFLDASNS